MQLEAAAVRKLVARASDLDPDHDPASGQDREPAPVPNPRTANPGFATLRLPSAGSTPKPRSKVPSVRKLVARASDTERKQRKKAHDERVLKKKMDKIKAALREQRLASLSMSDKRHVTILPAPKPEAKPERPKAAEAPAAAKPKSALSPLRRCVKTIAKAPRLISPHTQTVIVADAEHKIPLSGWLQIEPEEMDEDDAEATRMTVQAEVFSAGGSWPLFVRCSELQARTLGWKGKVARAGMPVFLKVALKLPATLSARLSRPSDEERGQIQSLKVESML